MSGNDMAAFEHFLHGQIECWNSSDKEGFFKHYRDISPNGLTIEYVGRPLTDAWVILEHMWAEQQRQGRFFQALSRYFAEWADDRVCRSPADGCLGDSRTHVGRTAAENSHRCRRQHSERQ